MKHLHRSSSLYGQTIFGGRSAKDLISFPEASSFPSLKCPMAWGFLGCCICSPQQGSPPLESPKPLGRESHLGHREAPDFSPLDRHSKCSNQLPWTQTVTVSRLYSLQTRVGWKWGMSWSTQILVRQPGRHQHHSGSGSILRAAALVFWDVC